MYTSGAVGEWWLEAAVQVKKVLKYGAIAFAAFFLLKRPDDAAGAVRGALDSVFDAADSLAQFVSHLS
ncbi:hypothetical protein GCM10010156_36170 [Planobispora rosea]|uniref:Uncharacterized protein n=1 Tax=Planobispora rosea TaxID=35762 RepID=A0A8J3RUN2_PLARO|nr:hypothetical protein GCM10010156_36170 [Planobispora rosea]GIH81690.1 hypothetical protein Pro02_00980 [Planobispora rosea]